MRKVYEIQTPVFINKILLNIASSFVYIYYLWLLVHCSSIESNRDRLCGHQKLSMYWLCTGFTRFFLREEQAYLTAWNNRAHCSDGGAASGDGLKLRADPLHSHNPRGMLVCSAFCLCLRNRLQSERFCVWTQHTSLSKG